MRKYLALVLILFVLLCALKTADSSSKKLYGFCYGPFRDGQNPGGVYPTRDQIKEDLWLLKKYTRRIRTYSVEKVLGKIPKLAKKAKLKCYAGAWIDGDPHWNKREIRRLIATSENAHALVVGNEVLLRETLPESDLISLIRKVRRRTNLPVGYADTWDEWLNHPKVAVEVDFLLVNIHPYWGGLPVENAAQDVNKIWSEAYDTYSRNGGKPVLIGETGWPSRGEVEGDAVPSRANQCKFLRRFYKSASQNSIPYFYFEAFDEKWKRTETGTEVEAHWGLFRSNRTWKPCVKRFFD